MPSSKLSALLTAVRVVLVAISVGVAALTIFHLATMAPPPPGSDGFAHGMAAIFGSVIIVASLGLAAVAVVLPTLLGREDALGFNRLQKLALKGAGILLGGGFVVGIAFGYVAGLASGIIGLLLFVALAAFVVFATLVWRLGEVVVRLASRAIDEGAS